MILNFSAAVAFLAPLARGLVAISNAYLFLGFLVFLLPVAAYCLYLAMINARQHPTMISGPWDFVGVLLATSGFVLVGGPTILGAFHNRYREALAQGQVPNFSLVADRGTLWLFIWGSYFLLVIGGSLWFLSRRRSVTMIYNVEPALLDEALLRVLERMKLESVRSGNRWLIGAPVAGLTPTPGGSIQVRERAAIPSLSAAEPERTGLADAVAGIGDPALSPDVRARLVLDPFTTMRHVTLKWVEGPATLRGDIEAELARQLSETETPDNPAASWFLIVAACLFGALVLALIVFLIFIARGMAR